MDFRAHDLHAAIPPPGLHVHFEQKVEIGHGMQLMMASLHHGIPTKWGSLMRSMTLINVAVA